MTNSRAKGAVGEREVAALLEYELGIKFKRNLEQCREAAHGDLITDDPGGFPFTIEVKRYGSGWTCRPLWEAQAFTAARAAGTHPCVIYRYNGQQWRCRIWIDAVAEALGGCDVSGVHFDTDIQGFCWIARELIARERTAVFGETAEVPFKGVIS